MRRFLKISVALALVLFILLITASFILKLYFPPEKIKELVITKITEALGRKVSVGDVNISLFKGVDIREIYVGENPEYGDIPFVRVKRITVGYNFKELLHKRVVLDSLAIERPEVFIRTRTGRPALSDLIKKPHAEEKPKAALPFTITVKKGEVRGLNLFYDADDAKAELKGIDMTLDGELFPLKEVNIAVSSRGADNIFASAKGMTLVSGLQTGLSLKLKGTDSFSARGEISLKGLRAALKGKSLSPLDAGAKLDVIGEVNGGATIKEVYLAIGNGSSIALSGTVKDLKKVKGMDVKVTGEADLAEISRTVSEFVSIPVTGFLKIGAVEIKGDVSGSMSLKTDVYLTGIKVSHKGMTVPLDGHIKGEADNKGVVVLTALKVSSGDAVKVEASANASNFGKGKVNARARIVLDNAKALRFLPKDILQKVGKVDFSGETLVNLTTGRKSETGPLKVNISGSSAMKSLQTGPISAEAPSATFSVISNDILKGKSFVNAGFRAKSLRVKKDDVNIDAGAMDVDIKASASSLFKKEGAAETKVLLKGLKLKKGDIDLTDEKVNISVSADSPDMFRKTVSVKGEVKADIVRLNKADIEIKGEMLDVSISSMSDDLPARKASIAAGLEAKGISAKKGDISFKEDMVKASVAASGDFKDGDVSLKNLELDVPKLVKAVLEGEVYGWGKNFALNGKVEDIDHRKVMDKIPQSIRQKLPKMDVEGRSTISASVTGSIAGDMKGNPLNFHGTLKTRDMGISIPEKGITVRKTDGEIEFALSESGRSVSGSMTIGSLEKADLLDGPVTVSTAFELLGDDKDLKVRKLSVGVPQKSVSTILSGDILDYSGVPKPNLDLKFVFNPPRKVEIIKGLNASGTAVFNASIRSDKEKELMVTGRLKMARLDIAFKDRAKVRDLNGDIGIVQGIRMSKEVELITKQDGKSGSMASIYDLMRPYMKSSYDLTLASASFDEFEVGPLSMDIAWSNGNIVIDRYELSLFDGDITGRLRAVYHKDAPEYSLSSSLAGVRLDKVFKDKKGGKETEINADLNLKGKGTDIEGEVNVTRIGKDLLDRGLLSLDPGESNPQIVDIRRKVNSLGWVPKEVSLWIRHGELNMDITLQRRRFTLLNIVSLQKIPVRRVPVGYLIKKGLKKSN